MRQYAYDQILKLKILQVKYSTAKNNSNKKVAQQSPVSTARADTNDLDLFAVQTEQPANETLVIRYTCNN